MMQPPLTPMGGNRAAIDGAEPSAGDTPAAACSAARAPDPLCHGSCAPPRSSDSSSRPLPPRRPTAPSTSTAPSEGRATARSSPTAPLSSAAGPSLPPTTSPRCPPRSSSHRKSARRAAAAACRTRRPRRVTSRVRSSRRATGRPRRTPGPRHSGAGEKHWGELIPKFTTLREVLLHGRGWYGETCLHLLLQLMVSGGGGGSSSGAAGGGGGPGGGGGGLMVVGGGATSPRATVGSGATLWSSPRASSASACSAATGAAGGAGSATQREGSSGGCPYRSALLRLLQPVPPHLTVQPLTRLTRAELAEIASAPFEGSLYHGVTPLHLAAAKNDLPIVRALIACGATVMHAPPARGTLLRGVGHLGYLGGTAVSFAASAGHLGIVTELLGAGAILDAAVDDRVGRYGAEVDPYVEDERRPAAEAAAVALLHAQHAVWARSHRRRFPGNSGNGGGGGGFIGGGFIGGGGGGGGGGGAGLASSSSAPSPPPPPTPPPRPSPFARTATPRCTWWRCTTGPTRTTRCSRSARRPLCAMAGAVAARAGGGVRFRRDVQGGARRHLGDGLGVRLGPVRAHPARGDRHALQARRRARIQADLLRRRQEAGRRGGRRGRRGGAGAASHAAAIGSRAASM